MDEQDTGTIGLFQSEGQLAFVIEGPGTMGRCAPLRRAAEAGLRGAQAPRLVVDLRRCTRMDSTFLGTLLQLQQAAQVLPGGRFALNAPSPECREELRRMGLEAVFAVVDEPTCPAERLQPLPVDDDLEQLKRSLVEAHQALARLPDPAGSPFRELAARLGREWQAERNHRSE